MLGLIPGMPHLVFLLIAGRPRLRGLVAARSADARRPRRAAPTAGAAPANAEASWDDLQPVDTLGLEVGYRLIALVDKARHGDLLGAHQGRAQEVRAGGRLPAAAGAHPRQPGAQAQRATASRCAAWWWARARPSPACAWPSTRAAPRTPLIGTATTDPAFGLPAVWIEERQRETAQMAGFTVVDCATVVATHLSHLMQVHAATSAGPRRDPATGRTRDQAGPQTDRRRGPQDGRHRHSAEGPAAAAGRGRAHPRHALHRRVPGRARRHRHRPGRAGPPHPRAPGAGHRAADLRPGARSST